MIQEGVLQINDSVLVLFRRSSIIVSQIFSYFTFSFSLSPLRILYFLDCIYCYASSTAFPSLLNKFADVFYTMKSKFIIGGMFRRYQVEASKRMAQRNRAPVSGSNQLRLLFQHLCHACLFIKLEP